MSPVLIECPVNHDLVATGLRADSADELEPENTLWNCPSCEGNHVWTPDDAVLTDVGT
jgi:hypothetical protein